jgi:hypothetical protein
VHQFECPLVVSHIDDLGDFDASRHDGIVFDDMSFAHLPREAVIHLVDWDLDRSIHIRYKRALIPARTRKIFTSNKTFYENFPADPSGAIRRRISRIIHVTGPTFYAPHQQRQIGAQENPEDPEGAQMMVNEAEDEPQPLWLNHSGWDDPAYLPGIDLEEMDADDTGYITN